MRREKLSNNDFPTRLSAVKAEHVEIMKKDSAAFGRLLSQNENFLNRIIHSFHGISTDTFEELRQEALIATWEALNAYDPNRGASFSTLVYRCVYNHCLGKLKEMNRISKTETTMEAFKRKNTLMGGLESGAGDGYLEDYWIKGSAGDGSFENQVIEAVDNEIALSKLSETDRKILDGKRNKLTRKQIAELVGMNYHTFRYYSVAFIDKMHKIFGKEEFNKKFEERKERMDKYVNPVKRTRKAGVKP